MNFDCIHPLRVAQAEMNPRVVGRDKAAPAEYVAPLADTTGGEIHGGAHRVPRALRSTDQAELHPVMAVSD